MKKFFFISSILLLIFSTAFIKNSTKRIDDEIYIVKEKKLRIGKFTSSLDEGLMHLIKYSIIITFISFLMIAFLKVLINFFIFINFNINLVYALFFSFIGIFIYITLTYIMNQIPFELTQKSNEV